MPRNHRLSLSVALTAALTVGADRATAEGLFASVGTEIDDENGYVLLGAIGGDLSERTTWDLGASRSDTSTTRSALSMSSYDASLYHDFGNIGLRFRLGSWADDALVQADELTATLDFHGEGWSFALETELRQSDFEPIAVDRSITLRDGTQLPIHGLVDCGVDDTGLGARLRLSSAAWSFGVSVMSFDYENFSCDFGFPVLDVLRNSTRDEFVQLADNLTGALSMGAGRRLLAENSFLDSRIGLSLSHDTGPRRYNVYYDSTEDVFFGRTADTLSGGVSFVLRSGSEIEVYAGVTELDARSSVAFLGFFLLILL
jgi:hypothetical protein